MKYGLTDNTEIYHILDDKEYSKCGIYIFHHDRRKVRPKGRRICKHCERKNKSKIIEISVDN